MSDDTTWHLDELTFLRGTVHIRGWAFGPRPIRKVEAVLPTGRVMATATSFLDSPDVAAVHGPAATRARFELGFTEGDAAAAARTRLVFSSSAGVEAEVGDFIHEAMAGDPYHRLTRRFLDMLTELPVGRVLEVGSRNRSGNVRRQWVDPHEYVGVDIAAGDNVDVVADAHELSQALAPESCDAAFSISTFEHLAMPWKVVLELNKVLKVGSLVLVSSHQTFPLHEMPWDFWRFSDAAWHALFNAATGFEVIETALGEPASIVAHLIHEVTAGLETQPAYIGSAVLARKTGPTQLRWDVSVDVVAGGTGYPH
jgi:hypothetical protein